MTTLTVGIRPAATAGEWETCTDGSAGQKFSVTIDLATTASDIAEEICEAIEGLGIFQATPNNWGILCDLSASVGYLVGVHGLDP